MPSPRHLFGQLKERDIRKTLTIYMSSALTTAGIVKLFSEAYRLPSVFFSVTVTFLTFGLASAFLFAWFRGKGEQRKTRPIEFALHSLLFAGALFVSFRIGGAQPALTVESDDVPSIAILYLKNLGPESDEPYSYGITQDLIVDIARAGLVRVAAMKDVLFFQTGNVTIDSIARALRVRYVLDASIRRDGELLRLSGQIVEAGSGRTLWADHLQTPMSQASTLQGRLAQTIIKVLDLKPSESIEKDITSRSVDPRVYEFYLRAKYVFDKRTTKEDVLTSRGLYERAIELDSTFVPARIGLGQTFEAQAEFQEAERIYERALQSARQSGASSEQAGALSRLGVVEWYRENHRKALEYYTQALTINTEIGDREGEGRLLNNIGLVYNMQGEYDTALDYYGRSLSIARELGDRWGEARTPNNIGTVYTLIGEYAKALGYYTEALKARQQLGDRNGECITLSNIGSAYDLQDDYHRALEYYNQALKIREELGDLVGQGQLLATIGSVHYKIGEYKKAQTQLQQGINLLKANGERSVVAPLSWLSLTEIRIGDRVGAQAHATETEDLLKTAPKTEEYIEVCRNLYQINTTLGHQARALEYLEQAYEEVVLRADRISDEGMRQSYLHNVKTTREVVTTWKEKSNIQGTEQTERTE